MVSSGFYTLTLVDKTREYGSVYSFRFQPEQPIAFVPGQYVHLMAPNSPPGRENIRHLSIASIPEEGPLRFSMDLSSGTGYKMKLAALEPGGKAHLFKVKGQFVLEPQPRRAVFLAGGIGITPVRALLSQINSGSLPVEWRLAHVARSEFLYEKELIDWGGVQRRIRHSEVELLVNEWTTDWVGARWYISGSSRFVHGMVELLKRRGIEDSDLRIEDFE